MTYWAAACNRFYRASDRAVRVKRLFLVRSVYEITRGSVQYIMRGTVRVDAPHKAVSRMIRERACSMTVEQDWYLTTEEDATQRSGQGPISSCRQHFVEHGSFPGRKPYPITLNVRPDLVHKDELAGRSRRGTCGSGEAHVDMAGDREGPKRREL
jgi:hypothetical protein